MRTQEMSSSTPVARNEAVRTLSSRTLLGERGLLHIEHEGQVYTLRWTRNDRLILTK